MLWEPTHRDARDASKARWKAHHGRTRFWSEREQQWVEVGVTGSGYIKNPGPNVDVGKSSWVKHCTIGEMYYRGFYIIHDATERPKTLSDLTRERVMDDAFPFFEKHAA